MNGAWATFCRARGRSEMATKSAGVLVFRKTKAGVEVFLAHPGGPFWTKRDDGAWTIPKGEIDEGEDAQAAALREFAEETGIALSGDMMTLGQFRQPSGKIVAAWALESDIDVKRVQSNDFEMEWPPHSGQQARFPEIDRAAWFSPDEALVKITKGQRAIVEAFCRRLGLAAG